MGPLAPNWSLVAHVLHPTKGVFSDKIKSAIEPESLYRRLEMLPALVRFCVVPISIVFKSVWHDVGDVTADAVAPSFPRPRMQSMGLLVIGGTISATSPIPIEATFIFYH